MLTEFGSDCTFEEITMPRSFVQLFAPVAAALAASIMATPACATDVQFASYNSVGTSAFNATNAGGVVTLSETGQVNFTFLSTALAAVVNGTAANVVFNATAPSTSFTTFGKHTFQDDLTGSFVFTSTNAITLGNRTYAAGSKLLTAVFTGAELSINYNSPTGSLQDDTLSGKVTYSSDFLSFPNSVESDFAISLSGLDPVLVNPLTQLSPFTASPAGIFSNDPGPVISPVPEPATWAMMLLGFGAIGLGLRSNPRRRRHAA